MMESAADVEANALAQRVAGRQDGTSRCQPESGHHFGRIGDLQFYEFLHAQLSGLQSLHPAGIVHAQDVRIAGRLRLAEIPRLREMFLE